MVKLHKANGAHSRGNYMPNLRLLYLEALRSIFKIDRLSKMSDWHSC